MKRVLLVLVIGASLMLGGCAIGVRPAGYYGGGYYEKRPVIVQPAPYYAPPRTIYRIERRIEIRPRSDRNYRNHRHYHHR